MSDAIGSVWVGLHVPKDKESQMGKVPVSAFACEMSLLPKG